jgi:hypothetical protein
VAGLLGRRGDEPMFKQWRVWILSVLSISILGLMAEAPRLRSGDIGGALAQIIFIMLFSFLIAYAVRGRKGNWKSFSRWFFWGALVLLICGVR